jgi:glutamine cyclotransferase
VKCLAEVIFVLLLSYFCANIFFMRLFYTLAAFVFIVSCNDPKEPGTETPQPNAAEPVNISYSVLNMYPHDTSSFTQGLQWYNNYLYEGTGLYGESHLMKVNLKDGKAVQKIPLDTSVFGEGITILNNKIYQLTWKEHKIFVYDVTTFKKLKEFNWDYEGWGITNDGRSLLISTGSNNIYFVDPETFRLQNTISVTGTYGPLGDLNELEYVDGKLYSNVWGSDYIARINPKTGTVEGRIDFSGMLQKYGKDYTGKDVLNGIAYNAVSKTFYITGKKWPVLFEIKLNQ